MSRIASILKRARITLADKNAERWSDDDLLEILNEGHKDLCIHSKIVHDRIDFIPEVGQAYYDLPDNVWILTRVTYMNKVLPIVSHPDLDQHALVKVIEDFGFEYSDSWEDETGSPLAILYDRRNINEIKVYPIPDASVVGTPYNFLDANYFGVVDTVEAFSTSGDFGVTLALEESNIKDNTTLPVFGVVVDVDDVKGKFKCYYLKVPADLVSVNDTLLTPIMFDTALKYYVVGHAFLNDLNETYQSKGAQQLQFYQRELAKAVETSNIDSTRASQFKVSYITPFR